MKINNRQQLLAVAAISMVGLWAATQLIVSPLYGSWKARNGRIAKLRQQVKDGNTTLGREKVTRERWENMRTNTLVNELSKAESQMLKAFDRWSRDSGVSVSAVRPQWKKGDDDYMTLECRVDASGDLPTLTRFLHEIERDPLGAKVDTVGITSRNPDGQLLTLDLLVSGLQLKRSQL